MTVIGVACHDVHIKGAWCLSDLDCNADGGYGFCNTSAHACQVSPDAGVEPGSDGGDKNDMAVIKCTSSSECTMDTNRPICDPTTHECRHCGFADAGADEECSGLSGGPYCGASGACVACQTNLDCYQQKLSCDQSSGSCVGCNQGSDCTTQLCMNKMCAGPTDYLYVKQSPSCNATIAVGSFDTPYCTIGAALADAASTSKTILVLPGVYNENLAIAAKATLLGVDNPTIASTSGNAITITGGNSAGVTVSLTGFTISGSGAANDGISCNGVSGAVNSTTVDVYQSTVSGFANYGVDFSNCRLLVDRLQVRNNGTGGINVGNSNALIQDALVVDNGLSNASGETGGILIAVTSSTAGVSTQIVNSTIAGNNSGNGSPYPGGVTCALQTGSYAYIFNSVIFSNTGPSTNEFNPGPSCQADHSAFEGAKTGSNSTSGIELTGCANDDVFANVTGGNWQPSANKTSCSLLGQGAASHPFTYPTGNTPTISAPGTDLLGNMRPAAGTMSYDVGAYQTQ